MMFESEVGVDVCINILFEIYGKFVEVKWV